MPNDTEGPALDRVEREPLSMRVARRIRQSIMAGELPDGAALPSEKELCGQLEVGRSTVREALRILQAQGLVTGGESVSTRAPVVSGPGAVTGAASALETVMLLNQVPVMDLVAVRLMIEEASVRVAAGRGEEDLGRARVALEEMEAAAGDVEPFLLADVAFHAALIDAAGNAAFTLINNVLRGAMAGHLRRGLEAERDPVAVTGVLTGEHREILAAVEAGDGDAAAGLVRRHIESFYQRQAGGPARR